VAHILRDMSPDLELNKTGLVYVPLKDLDAFAVSEGDLFEFKRTGNINDNFRAFMKLMVAQATSYEHESYQLLANLVPYLGQDAKFILTLLLSLYSETIRRIERVNYNVFQNTHHLTEWQKLSLMFTTAKTCGYRLSRILRIYWKVLARNRSVFRYADTL
jgi:phytoene/squalene synthetase